MHYDLDQKENASSEIFSLALKNCVGPGQCGLVGWSISHKLKGHMFDSQSGHMPGLQVQSLVGSWWGHI